MPRKPKQTKANEMQITLATLVEIDACIEARTAFEREFGETGAPTAKEVFRAIARGKRHDWLFWLGAQLKGFIQAVGNEDEGEFHCRIDGEFELSAGFMISSGSATVRAYGSATVEASGSATVRASGSATVRAYGSATVEAYDSATVEASGSATVEAYGSATVEAYDSATVRAYDSATVLLTCYSLRVVFSIKSDMACAVDRRNGKPKLILAEPEAVSEEC